MSWSLASMSPPVLARVEWWLWLAAVLLVMLGVGAGVVARQAGRYRLHAVQEQLTTALHQRDEQLTAALRQRDATAEELARVSRELEIHAPRRVSARQRAILVEQLHAKPIMPVTIVAVFGDREGLAYATEIAGALAEAGVTVRGPFQGAYAPSSPVGLLIRVRDPRRPPPGAEHLGQAMRAAGFALETDDHGDVVHGDVGLVVGTKPPLS